MEDGGGILTKGGEPAPDFLNIFRPFPLGVWLILCACILTTGAVLFAISKTDTASGVSGGQHTTWSLDDCLLLTFSSLVSQGASPSLQYFCTYKLFLPFPPLEFLSSNFI